MENGISIEISYTIFSILLISPILYVLITINDRSFKIKFVHRFIVLLLMYHEMIYEISV